MAEVLKKQRKSNFSQEEVDSIVRAVSNNYETLYGEFSKKAMYKNARHRAWLEVTKEVNLVSNEKRTLQEVKNKWKKCQYMYRSDDYYDLNDFGEDVFDVSNVWEPLTEIEDEDSMPLEQRIKPPVLPEPTEPVLQSQPLSPTKLKVTRQAKPSLPSPKPPTPPPPPIEEICLKWNSHHSNIQNTFPNLLLKEQYVDATLVAEGQTLKCHRVILSSSSPYFEEVLASISPYQHPVLFMKDVPFWILKCLCDFMYAGEVHILQTKLEDLLAVAETLKIKGLAGQTETKNQDIKPEPPKLAIEEIIEEAKKKEDKEIKKKEEKEIKKKEEKDIKKKEEKEIKKKEEKEIKKKEEKEIKKKEEKEIKKKEEKEIKKKEDKEIKKKEEKEIKKKEEKEIKKKEEKELKSPEIKQPRRKEEIKKKDEKEVKEKKRIQLALSPEMPILKSAKAVKVPVQQLDMPILKSTKSPKSSGISRRTERKVVEKEKIVENPLPPKETIHKKGYLDPILDLLEPVYEEVAKDPKPSKVNLPKDPKHFTVRRSIQKKVKKRKITDDREESPPPVFTRKGTRSRPNRKVPKFFHPSDDQSTIVREPHTDQADPLMHLQCIKSELLYDVDDSIEIEDNLVGFSESSLSVEEQLIDSYDHTSFGSYSRRTTRSSQKELQPIIMDVHSIANKKEEASLRIINVAELRDPKLDPLEDPLTLSQSGSSPALVEVSDNSLGFRISQVITEKEDSRSSEICTEMGFQITNVISEQDIPKKNEEMEVEEEESLFTEIEEPEKKHRPTESEDCSSIGPTATVLESMDTYEDSKASILKTNVELDSNKIITGSEPPNEESNTVNNEFIDTQPLEFNTEKNAETPDKEVSQEYSADIFPAKPIQENPQIHATQNDNSEFLDQEHLNVNNYEGFNPVEATNINLNLEAEHMETDQDCEMGVCQKYTNEHTEKANENEENQDIQKLNVYSEKLSVNETLGDKSSLGLDHVVQIGQNKINESSKDSSAKTQENEFIERLEEELLNENNDISNDFDPGTDNKNYEENILNDDYIPEKSDSNRPYEECASNSNYAEDVNVTNESVVSSENRFNKLNEVCLAKESDPNKLSTVYCTENLVDEDCMTKKIESIEIIPEERLYENYAEDETSPMPPLAETCIANNSLDKNYAANSSLDVPLQDDIEPEKSLYASHNVNQVGLEIIVKSHENPISSESNHGKEEAGSSNHAAHSSLDVPHQDEIEQENSLYASHNVDQVGLENIVKSHENSSSSESNHSKEEAGCSNHAAHSSLDVSHQDDIEPENSLYASHNVNQVGLENILKSHENSISSESDCQKEEAGSSNQAAYSSLDVPHQDNIEPKYSLYASHDVNQVGLGNILKSHENPISSESNCQTEEAGSSNHAAHSNLDVPHQDNIEPKNILYASHNVNPVVLKNIVKSHENSTSSESNCQKEEASSSNNAEHSSLDVPHQDDIEPENSLYASHNVNPVVLENIVKSHENPISSESNHRTEEAGSSNQPGFHIAQVVSEQIAEIEGNRFGDGVADSVLNEPCGKNYNELESIVNDLSKIVGDTCGESSLGSGSMDDTNSIADSLENLLQK